MKRFEYYTVSGKTLDNNRKLYECSYSYRKPNNIYMYFDIDHFGEDGWELVSVTDNYEHGTMYYFKREKND